MQFKDKQESRTMKWVYSAAETKRNLPVLKGIHVDNGRTVATDGFRLHVANTPDTLKELSGKTLKPQSNITITPRPLELEEIEGTFPDWKQLMTLIEGKPTVRIKLNKQFLADLKDMPADDDGIILNVYSSKQPVYIEGDGAEALIMPMRLDD